MQRVHIAKFYGCSPSQVRDMTIGEIAATNELAKQLAREAKRR